MKKVFMMILLCGLLSACGKASVAVREGIVIEYGSEIKAEELTEEKVTLKEVKNYDAKKIGEQKVIAVFVNKKEKEIEEEITLEVKDTKKPEIKLKKDKVEITESDQFDPVSNIEAVKDPVDGDIKKSEDKKLTKNGYLINSDVDSKKAGSYTVTITAYDVNGNKAESSYQVTVKEKPQEQAPAATQSSNQASGYSGYSNNTGSTTSSNASTSTSNGATSNTQTQPQQTCKAGYVHPNQIGNSGKIFNSEQEAIDYGNKIDAEDPNILGFGYAQLADDCDNLLNKWTVEFGYVGQYEDGFVK